MNLLPKPDAKLLEAAARLKNLPDFQQILQHQQARYSYLLELLVTAAPDDVPRLQGQAQELREFFALLKDLKR